MPLKIQTPRSSGASDSVECSVITIGKQRDQARLRFWTIRAQYNLSLDPRATHPLPVRTRKVRLQRLGARRRRSGHGPQPAIARRTAVSPRRERIQPDGAVSDWSTPGRVSSGGICMPVSARRDRCLTYVFSTPWWWNERSAFGVRQWHRWRHHPARQLNR
jgi:hypothetical protein